MTVDEIVAFRFFKADDSVLLLWATAPKLPEALHIMQEWGYEYKTCAVWDKVRLGMGYWFRSRHELLLVGTRGRVHPPDPTSRIPSILEERRRGQHSRKPEVVYAWVERAFPEAMKLELFARRRRPGWEAEGNEL